MTVSCSSLQLETEATYLSLVNLLETKISQYSLKLSTFLDTPWLYLHVNVLSIS